MKGDRERCLDSGMDDYVAKPIRPRVLFDKIASLLDTENPAMATDSINPKEPQQGGAGKQGAKRRLPPVDWEAALQTAMGDRAVLRELAEDFLKEGDTSPYEMHKAVEEKRPSRRYPSGPLERMCGWRFGDGRG